jgi:hypothetical protein
MWALIKQTIRRAKSPKQGESWVYVITPATWPCSGRKTCSGIKKGGDVMYESQAMSYKHMVVLSEAVQEYVSSKEGINAQRILKIRQDRIEG